MKKLLILMLIITFAGAAQGVYFEDNFDHITTTPTSWDRVNYLGWYEQSLANPYPGGPWTIGMWDGFISIAPASDNIQRTQVAYNFVETFNYGLGEYDVSTDPDKVQAGPGYGLDPAGEAPGVLRIMSIDSYWVDGLNSGPFLYKMVGTGDAAGSGNFIAEVEIVSQNAIWSNLGGLMARDPASAGDATENWVYLTYFPEWGVGNHIRTTVGGASTEMGIKGYPCDPYLRLQRIGTAFYFYTSPDGVTYNPLMTTDPGDPNNMIPLVVDRPDMPAELQVGIFQANYDAAWIGSMDFDNFVLIPEPATIALLGLGGLALIRRKR